MTKPCASPPSRFTSARSYDRIGREAAEDEFARFARRSLTILIMSGLRVKPCIETRSSARCSELLDEAASVHYRNRRVVLRPVRLGERDAIGEMERRAGDHATTGGSQIISARDRGTQEVRD